MTNTRFPARTALVAALALAFGAPTFASDAQGPLHIAQASSGGGGSGNSSGSTGAGTSSGSQGSTGATSGMGGTSGSGTTGSGTTGSGTTGQASGGSNDKASSSPAMVNRPGSDRSTTSGSTTGDGRTGAASGATSTGTPAGARSADPRVNPGTTGFREFGDNPRTTTGTASGATGTASGATGAASGSGTSGLGTTAGTSGTGTTSATGAATSGAESSNRSVRSSANPGTEGFRHWWSQRAQGDGRITRDQYNQEMDRRWREMDQQGRGLTAEELDRLHGWSGPNAEVQPGASRTDVYNRPHSDNAQAK